MGAAVGQCWVHPAMGQQQLQAVGRLRALAQDRPAESDDALIGHRDAPFYPNVLEKAGAFDADQRLRLQQRGLFPRAGAVKIEDDPPRLLLPAEGERHHIRPTRPLQPQVQHLAGV